MSPARADVHPQQLRPLIDREQLARKLELRLGEVVAHVEQRGFPRPVASYDSSLGQRIQAAHQEARVVKALNTMN